MQKKLNNTIIIIFYIITTLLFNSIMVSSNRLYAEETKYFSTHELFSFISKKFPQRITVGFDVCDTLLFTTAGIQHYIDKNCPDNWDNCMNNEKFWEEYNGRALKYSLVIPKSLDIINFHKKRGDKIIFITARKKTKNGKLSETIQRNFDIKIDSENLLFSGNSDKKELIKNNEIAIFYGDSDNDMISAINGKAIPIRIQRNELLSYYKAPDYNLSKFNEIIIEK